MAFARAAPQIKRIMKKIIVLILIICLSLSVMTVSGCSDNVKSPSEDGELKVLCAGFVAYDLCREILGGEESITLLGRAGIDMHSFEPTAADILALAEADVFVIVGGESSKWADGMLKSAKNESVITVRMVEYSKDVDSDHDHDHENHETDEHVWMSLSNVICIVGAIEDAICNAARANGLDEKVVDAYRQNAKKYSNELVALKSEFAQMVNNSRRRVILVADRFPFVHLACELGLEYYAAFPGCSTETNASFATQAELIEKTKELKLPCIFKIDGSDGVIADKISVETGARVLVLDSAQMVSAERMKTEGYLNIMKKNLVALSEALN